MSFGEDIMSKINFNQTISPEKVCSLRRNAPYIKVDFYNESIQKWTKIVSTNVISNHGVYRISNPILRFFIKG